MVGHPWDGGHYVDVDGGGRHIVVVVDTGGGVVVVGVWCGTGQ